MCYAYKCKRRLCECVKQIHITRATVISHGYNKANLTKHGVFCFAKKDLTVIKTDNEYFSFIQWNKYFHLFKKKDENICTIALINIHYLYTIPSKIMVKNEICVRSSCPRDRDSIQSHQSFTEF